MPLAEVNPLIASEVAGALVALKVDATAVNWKILVVDKLSLAYRFPCASIARSNPNASRLAVDTRARAWSACRRSTGR
jgi:hypothetical protein